MITKNHSQKIAARPFSRMRTLGAGIALAAACLVAGPALADTMTYFPGGEVHTWTGDHGETFKVTRTYNNGKKVVKIDRHDRKGFVDFVTPPPLPIVNVFSGSLYDPDTDLTTTIVVGPNFRGSSVEDHNRLREHADMQPPKYTHPISGSLYDPKTDKTTTIVGGKGGYIKGDEKGNTLGQHGDMQRPKYTRPISGSLYDPDTNRTTTIKGGPNGSTKMVERGNTLRSH